MEVTNVRQLQRGVGGQNTAHPGLRRVKGGKSSSGKSRLGGV